MVVMQCFHWCFSCDYAEYFNHFAIMPIDKRKFISQLLPRCDRSINACTIMWHICIKCNAIHQNHLFSSFSWKSLHLTSSCLSVYEMYSQHNCGLSTISMRFKSKFDGLGFGSVFGFGFCFVFEQFNLFKIQASISTIFQ